MSLNKEFLRDYLKLTLAVMLTAYFYFYGGTKFNLIDLTALSKTGILLAACWITLLILGRSRQTPVDGPLLAVILVLLLTSFTGVVPRQALVEVGYLLIAALLFYCIVGLIHLDWNPRILSKAILIIGGVFMVLAWLEFLAWVLAWFKLDTGVLIPPFPYRLPAPNFICAIMNSWILFALAHFFHVKEKTPRIILGAYIISALGILLLTSSRGGWLGMAGGMGVFFAIYLIKRRSQWLQSTWRTIRKPKYIIPLLGLGLLMLVIIGFIFVQQENQPTHGPILQSRNMLWNPAFIAIPESPWIGHGPYAYIFYFLRYNSVPPTLLFDYAHNIYLDILVSSGILGLVVFFIFLAVLIKSLFKVLNDPDPYFFTLGLGVIAGLAAFLIHGLFDSVHHTVPVSLWHLCILLGIAVGLGSKGARAKSLMPLGVGLLLFPAMIWYIYSGMVYERGLTLAMEGNTEQAIYQLAEAARLDPALALIPQQSGILLAQLADQTDNTEILIKARQAFEESLLQDDSWSPSDLNLGVIAAELDDLDAAETYLMRAVELAPKSALNYWNMALFYESIGEYKKATAAFEQCLSMDNRIILSEVWQQTPLRIEFSKQWQAKNGELVQQLEQSLLDTKGGMMAVRYPGHASNPAYTLYHVQQASQAIRENRLSDAQNALDAGKLAYTNFTESKLQTFWLQGEIYAAQGDWHQAASWGEMAIQAVIRPGLLGPGSYSQQIFGPVVYRRHELPDYFVPQVQPLPINKEWMQRLDELIVWYEQDGNLEKASQWKAQRALIIDGEF
jgi:O-antigen ligase/tetratricopeptide (TPR) repeat protein